MTRARWLAGGAALVACAACGSADSTGLAVCGNAPVCEPEGGAADVADAETRTDSSRPPHEIVVPKMDAGSPHEDAMTPSSPTDATAPMDAGVDAARLVDGSLDAHPDTGGLDADTDSGLIVLGDRELASGATSLVLTDAPVWFVPIEAPVDCTVVDMGLRGKSDGGTIRLALYADSAGQPGKRLALGPEIQVKTGESVFVPDALPPLVAGTRYWIAGTAIASTVTLYENLQDAHGAFCYAQQNPAEPLPTTFAPGVVACSGTAPSINWFVLAQPRKQQ